MLLAAAAAFRPAPPRRRTPPLQAANLEEAVRRKLQEAQRLDARHAGPDSDARLRLGYVADRGNVRFSAALRRGDGVSRKVAVVADIKRRSPHGGPDNGAQELASYADCGPRRFRCQSLARRRFVRVSRSRNVGWSDGDLVAASKALNNSAPLLAKDLIVHPIQVALAAEAGADAVWLSATILGGALPDLLDACTVAGVEGAVEVHTPNEVQFALEAGATLLICSDRDRATGILHRHQCLGLKGLIPPNIVALAAGDLGVRRRRARAGRRGLRRCRARAGADGGPGRGARVCLRNARARARRRHRLVGVSSPVCVHRAARVHGRNRTKPEPEPI